MVPNAPEVSPATVSPATMVGPRLSLLMFLQFFLWGAWFVTLGPYMNALKLDGADVNTGIGNAYSMAQVAAIASPFFLGLIADRFFASQVVLGVLHVLGGAIFLAVPRLVHAGDSSSTLVGLVLAHMLCYMPTLGLSNTVAFNAMTNPEKQFPLVRVWGTIGWIAAGFAVSFVGHVLIKGEGADAEAARSASPHFFHIAGISGVLLGLYCFTLPNTPAPMKGKKIDLASTLGVQSLALLKKPDYLVFALASMLICIPLAAYYSFAGVYAGAVGLTDVPVKMSFGQMSEIAFMLVMPLCFARLGVKWMLAVGMLAWVVRYGLFAAAWQGTGGHHLTMLVLVGIALHGVCYDFFFVTGQIYTERAAPKEIRAQAQGFLVLLTQGVGMFLGNQLFARVAVAPNTALDGSRDWLKIWFYPAAFGFAILFVFILAFRGKISRASDAKSE